MNRKLLVLPALLVVAALIFLATRNRDGAVVDGRLLASGTVEATEARLGFQLPGRLLEVTPREGDRVEAGALLATLDQREAQARRDEAAARLDASQSRLAELESGFRSEEIAQARAAVGASEERLADAGRDLERNRTLHAGGALPDEALEKSTSAVELATRGREEARQRLRLLERGPRPEQIAAQRSAVDQARASLALLEVHLDDRTLHAPFSGLVTVRHREPGETVAPGTPVLTLMDPADRWVRIYIPEPRLGAVSVGARAAIRSDTFPDRRYPGEVVFVASEAEFTPKSVQTPEERVRLVYAVKVRVLEDPGLELKPGMPVDVEIELPEGSTDGATP